MRIDVVTLFPELFSSFVRAGVVGRAISSGRVALELWNPRRYADDQRQSVDDRAYGGGPGMVLMAPPVCGAIDAALGSVPGKHAKVIFLSPEGRRLDQNAVTRLSSESRLLLLAGRYEGIDQRVINSRVDEIWSVGDYVLSGGEIPAMVLIDAVVRLLPGVLGNQQSAQQDSFISGLLDCPHYTRPETFEGSRVPQVLLSGDHQAIGRWRSRQALLNTWRYRPDLLVHAELSEEQWSLLGEELE